MQLKSLIAATALLMSGGGAAHAAQEGWQKTPNGFPWFVKTGEQRRGAARAAISINTSPLRKGRAAEVQNGKFKGKSRLVTMARETFVVVDNVKSPLFMSYDKRGEGFAILGRDAAGMAGCKPTDQTLMQLQDLYPVKMAMKVECPFD